MNVRGPSLSTLARTALAIVLVVYLSRSGILDWAALGGLIVRWPLAAAGLAMLALCMVATASRLRVLLSPHGLRLSFESAIRLTLISTFFSFFLPGATGGDAARIYYATSGNRGRRAEVVTVLLMDRLVGMMALLLFPLLAAPFFAGIVGDSPVLVTLLGAAASLVAVLALGVALATSRLIPDHTLARILALLPFSSILERMAATARVYREHRMPLALALGLSLLAHACAVGAALCVAGAVTGQRVVPELTFLIPLGFMANAIPLTPAGLGVGEVVFDRLFALAGQGGGAATMLGWRLLLLGIGGVGLLAYLQGHSRFVHDREETALQTPSSAAGTAAASARTHSGVV